MSYTKDLIEKSQINYKTIMLEVATLMIQEANLTSDRTKRTQLVQEADIIKSVIAGNVPVHLGTAYRAAAMKLAREADPEWETYTRLRLKFGNVDVQPPASK